MIALAALTLSLHLQRSSFDMLDGVDIAIAVHNTDRAPENVIFPKATEYQIEIYRGKDLLWTSQSSDPVGTALPAHTRQFLPGPTTLAIYIWNGVESDASTPAPGTYTIRAKLLGSNASPTASAEVRFGDSTPVSALAQLRQGDVVTIAGTLDATRGLLTDSTGTVTLERKLLRAPANATIAVRGFLTTRPDRTRAFFVQRWAVVH